VKCTPLNRKFKIAIVDGLAGGGSYKCGTSGSPLVFLEELSRFIEETTLWRKDQNLPELEIECLFIVNDTSPEARERLYPLLTSWELQNAGQSRLSVSIIRMEKAFSEAYPEIKARIQTDRHSNVLFNLDPCGYTQVGFEIIQDIMCSFKSPEVFYTFMIGALFNYASWKNPQKTQNLIRDFGVQQEVFFEDQSFRTKDEWLGAVERILHTELRTVANFVSPFAINQERNQGYNYWLLHFSKSHRAREVYNDVLHQNAGGQAHFGKSGLKMLEYTANETGVRKFDFGADFRTESKFALHTDLPAIIHEFGDVIPIELLKASIYNDTAVHPEELSAVMIENQDIEVLTPAGSKRRVATAIKDTDLVRVTTQKHLFPIPSKK